MDLFAGLNPPQRKAVEAVKGRVLILAGAGSGKTRVLTLRMAHLIKNLGCHPQSILGLTFTNKAAAEMRHRLSLLISPKEARQVTLCTFHSFCMQVLRTDIERLGYTNNFTLYDEKDVQRLMSMIARDLLEHEGELPSLSPTAEIIAFAKNRGLEKSEIKGTGSSWHDEFAQNVYVRLQDSMRAYNAVDFDSLLSLTVDLFEQFPAVLESYQERFRYLMIDEYQDTNPIQYRLASLLASKYQNLCVVGDDDQSIYGWRGADIQNILDFSDAQVIMLEQNYRSTNTILKAANSVISNNPKRHAKILWSEKGEGPLIEVFHAKTEEEEAQAVVARMVNLRKNQGLKWKDMAVLYRSNALSRSIEQALIKQSWQDGDAWVRGIPYQIFGGTEFYERREVKDLMGYLRVIVNPLDQEALLRIINHPRRGIGDGSLDALTAYNRQHGISLWEVLNAIGNQAEAYAELIKKIPAKALNGVKEFLEILCSVKNKFEKEPPSQAFRWLIETINYKKAIAEEVKSEQMRDFKWENVQEFVSALAHFEQNAAPDRKGLALLQDFVLSSALDKGWEGNTSKKNEEDLVSLMTIHSSKGLEFPACFIIAMEDHIIPHEKSLKQTGAQEERRLMYVALTRAMTYLTLSMARQRKRMGVEAASSPSRFLLEIPKEQLRRTHWHEI